MVLKYSDWHRPYKALLQESDPQKLAGLVNVVETTMFSRLQELSTSSDGHDERQAIAEAANRLLGIKRGVLGFPGLEFIDQKEGRAKTEPD